MKVFIICPVRYITPEFEEDVKTQVAFLEDQGHEVYYPIRDTNQAGDAWRTCQDNRAAMAQADEVYVAWDGESAGALFDLGMAFAMGKPLSVLTGLMPAMTRNKSFQNLCYDWEEYGAM